MPNSIIQRYSALPLLLELHTNGHQLSTATGFVAEAPAGPVLVTCRHVVTGRDNNSGKPLAASAGIPDEIVIRHNGSDGPQNISQVVSVRQALLDTDGKPLWVEHPTLGRRADLVALSLRQTSRPVVLLPSTLGVGDPPIVCVPSEPVSVVGFPFGKSGPGQFAIWATGFIASEMSISYDGLPVFLIDCRSRPGQSGAPVVAYRATGAVTEDGNVTTGTASRFLGVYSGRIHPESDIGMVWNVAAVQELVAGCAS